MKYTSKREKLQPKFDLILNAVYMVTSMDKKSIIETESGKRSSKISTLCYMISNIAKDYFEFRVSDLSAYLERDHAAITNYIKTHKNLYDVDKEYRKIYKEIELLCMPHQKDFRSDEHKQFYLGMIDKRLAELQRETVRINKEVEALNSIKVIIDEDTKEEVLEEPIEIIKKQQSILEI